jgi:hypothetical protein
MPETMTRSVTAKIRFPREVLAVVDDWATAHQLPRSQAVRILLLRGMWIAQPAAEAITLPVEVEGDR